MKSIRSVIALILALMPLKAWAIPVTVNFEFAPIASGSFTYDSSLDGTLLTYLDLDSFTLSFSGLTNTIYDLTFILSGDFSVYYHYVYDTVSESFISNTDLDGVYTTLAAIKNDFGSGFFVRDDTSVIRDYVGGGGQTYTSFSLVTNREAVPEPGMLLLLAGGLAGVGLLARRAKPATNDELARAAAA